MRPLRSYISSILRAVTTNESALVVTRGRRYTVCGIPTIATIIIFCYTIRYDIRSELLDKLSEC